MTTIPTAGEEFSKGFMSQVQKSDTEEGCWNWIGLLRNERYGGFWHDGRNNLAHRMSYKMFVGEVPDSINVLHHCDNCLCVNPKHLFLGTQLDNVHDMISKGRQCFGDKRPTRGSKSGLAKLKEEEVVEIKEYLVQGWMHREIADIFGVSRQAITNISTGHRWGWL